MLSQPRKQVHLLDDFVLEQLPPHSDLVNSITLELIAVLARPHVGLLASKSGGKASANLGAPHGSSPCERSPIVPIQQMVRTNRQSFA